MQNDRNFTSYLIFGSVIVLILSALLYGQYRHIHVYRDFKGTEIIKEGKVTDKRLNEYSCESKGRSTCQTYYLSIEGTPVVVTAQIYTYTDIGDSIRLVRYEDKVTNYAPAVTAAICNLILCILLFIFTIWAFFRFAVFVIATLLWELKYPVGKPTYREYMTKFYTKPPKDPNDFW